MSPRPRKASDEEVFGAMIRVMSRVGPADLTLAAVAEEAGLTAGALVQRFGSKHAMMVAAARGAAEHAGLVLEALADKHRSPLAALRDYAECMAQLAPTPDQLARNLAYLANDISDAALRKHLLVQSRATRAGLRKLLDRAVAQRELKPRTDTAKLAKIIETVLGGALISWATWREGSARTWLRDHFEAVIEAHLA